MSPPASMKRAIGRLVDAPQHRLRAARSVWTASSVFDAGGADAREVLRGGGDPASCSPSANGTPLSSTAAGVEPKPRSSAAMSPPGRASSSTGARSTLTPTSRRFRAVRLPCSRLKAGPLSPISRADASGRRRSASPGLPPDRPSPAAGRAAPAAGGSPAGSRSASDRRHGSGGCRCRREDHPRDRAPADHVSDPVGDRRPREAGDDPLPCELRRVELESGAILGGEVGTASLPSPSVDAECKGGDREAAARSRSRPAAA